MKIEYSKLIGESGHYKTQSLFYEFRYQTNSDYMPFTLKERDVHGHQSIYQIYMSCDSEYEAAQKLLGSWKHWEILCECTWFIKELDKWREEREIREAAIGKAMLIEKAKEGNVPAARSLLESSSKRKAGRPSSAEVINERKKQAAVDTKVSSIIERMANK